jgi:hypothetical protein
VLKDLPKRIVETVSINFGKEEQEIYRSIEGEYVIRFNRFLKVFFVIIRIIS